MEYWPTTKNYPSGDRSSAPARTASKLNSTQLNVPLLVFHGLQSTALHYDGLNNTWDWNDADTTIVSAPTANHFVQQDAPELVTSNLKWWLRTRN